MKTYKFVAQVYNNSRAIESVYKLNIYFVGDISKMKFAWKEYESKITYTALENNRLKISAIGVIPIFHEETVDVGRFEIIIPREFKAAFIQNTKIELKLFYSNGMDEQESELKIIQVLVMR